MKTLVVISGKGGTGKTSFCASFAQLAGEGVVLGDCDVAAANLALLISGEDVEREDFFAGSVATVDGELCIGCGECNIACRYEAIELSDDVARVNHLRCEGCRACSVVCPVDAIQFANKRAGTILRRETALGPMVHAALGIAQDNSGKLVARVREDAQTIAKERGIGLALFDGPPGIGCPVHAAVGGADLLIAVTEPTSSGSHDLERVLYLARHFDLRVGVVVNKYDLNIDVTEQIEQMAEQHEALLLGRVPFDEGVPRALAESKTPLSVPAVRMALVRCWDKIIAAISKQDDD